MSIGISSDGSCSRVSASGGYDLPSSASPDGDGGLIVMMRIGVNTTGGGSGAGGGAELVTGAAGARGATCAAGGGADLAIGAAGGGADFTG